MTLKSLFRAAGAACVLGSFFSFATAAKGFAALPSGYTRVQYVQGNGTDAYLESNFALVPATDKIVCEVEPTAVNINQSVFSSRGNLNANPLWCLTLRSDNGGSIRYDFNVTGTPTGSIIAGTRYTFTAEGNTLKWSGGADIVSTGTSPFTPTDNLQLFGFTWQNNPTFVGSHRLYSFKVYRSGTLIHDLVPVKDANGKATLYDNVESPMTLTHHGGDLTAGPEVVTDGFTVANNLSNIAGTLSPAAGYYQPTNGTVFTATDGTADGVRSTCYGATLAVLDESGATISSSNVVGRTFSYASDVGAIQRLTWQWTNEVAVTFGSFSGGSLKLDGAEVAAGSTTWYTQSGSTSVTLVATPDEGWAFSRWNGNVPSGNETRYSISLPLSAAYSLTPVFTRVNYLPNPSFETGSKIKNNGTYGVIDGTDTYTADWTFGGTVYLGKNNSGVIKNGWPVGSYAISIKSGAATNAFSIATAGLYVFSFRRAMTSGTATLSVKIDGKVIDASTVGVNYAVNGQSPITSLKPVYLSAGDHELSLEATTSVNLYLMIDDLWLERLTCGVDAAPEEDDNMSGGVAAQVTSSETIRTFTLTGTNYLLTVKRDTYVEMLVVGGGGGGGNGGGYGGGAGAVIHKKDELLKAGTYVITLGTGGASGISNAGGATGKPTLFVLTNLLEQTATTIVEAPAGGGGGCWSGTGLPGACGGGKGGLGTRGLGCGSSGSAGAQVSGGGGGGILSPGTVGTGTQAGPAGDGGKGIYYDITGESDFWGWGGGGQTWGGGAANSGVGDPMGFGHGASLPAGTQNYGRRNHGGGGGGGGIGGYGTGAEGGCGVVLIRYSTPATVVSGAATLRTLPEKRIGSTSLKVAGELVDLGGESSVSMKILYGKSATALTGEVALGGIGVGSAWAYGPWLEWTPVGGVELGGPGALGRTELTNALAAIERDCAEKPVIFRRAKALSYLFDHVRLAVNTNDLFVHWHPDGSILPLQKEARVAAFAKSAPERRHAGGWMCEGGSFTCRLDTSHTCPDWKSVLELGPKGLAARARARRETAKTDDERLFLDCVAEVYEALARECLRWAAFAEEKGMREVAAVLRENAAHPPRTFREALQWALVYDRAQETEGEDVRSQGLFDRLFIGFYRADLAAGRETRESAKRLLADYYTRLWSQQHPNGKNIAFGGYDAKGEPVWNELTELGFEVFRELGRINPKLTYRFGRKTPRAQLEKVTRCLAEGKTSVVFACEETLYETFLRHGKEMQDLADYVLVGCYEPGIGGREIIASMAADVNLAKPLETVLARPADELPADGAAFERAYLAELEKLIDRAMAVARETEAHWYELNPAPLFSGSFRDCIANARDYSQGGCRYNSSGIVLVGLGTAADALASVSYLVDGTKACTMAELAEAMKADWEGFETLRLKARNGAPKWGNNDPRADAFGQQIYSNATARVNAAKNGHGGFYQAGAWSIYLDLRFGAKTGATPEGRRRGETLSRNNVATAGCGTEGPTALILSNLKLDLAEAPDGHIMDILLPASLKTGPRGAARIADLIATYFAKGGQCLHLNCFDSKTLKDAYAHPEKYPDLQVRVCGWNVRWADLSDAERRHFIATAEAQEGADR